MIHHAHEEEGDQDIGWGYLDDDDDDDNGGRVPAQEERPQGTNSRVAESFHSQPLPPGVREEESPPDRFAEELIEEPAGADEVMEAVMTGPAEIPYPVIRWGAGTGVTIDYNARREQQGGGSAAACAKRAIATSEAHPATALSATGKRRKR